MLSVQNIWYSNKEPIAILKAKKKLGAKEGDHVLKLKIKLSKL